MPTIRPAWPQRFTGMLRKCGPWRSRRTAIGWQLATIADMFGFGEAGRDSRKWAARAMNSKVTTVRSLAFDSLPMASG